MKKNLNFIVKTCLWIGILLWWGGKSAHSQVDTTFSKRKLFHHQFMALVGQNNFGYAAEKFQVSIADANLLAAGIFPDPELSVGWFDNGQRRMNMGYGFGSGLSWTLELGGKRKARINLAQSEYELSKYLLQNYFRNLRADATLLYLKAMQNKLLLEVQWSSYQTMNRLAKSDSIRFRLGSITQIDARQSKLEAGTMLNDVIQAEAEWKICLAGLAVLTGTKQSDTLWLPMGNFSGFDRNFKLADLITTALNQRADLQAALQNKRVSQSALKLAKANRVADLGLSTGITYASYVRNVIAPTPAFTSVNAGVAIPLKFSNNRPGEWKAAYFASRQADALYQQTEVEIQAEVTQAHFAYVALQKQVQQFNNGLLSDAKSVLDGKIYSYQRGETSLLEVLNAQRTYNEVQQSYYQTLYDYAAALVELERAVGMWDINF